MDEKDVPYVLSPSALLPIHVMLVDATGVCAKVLAVVTEKRALREIEREQSMAIVQKRWKKMTVDGQD